MDVNTKQSNISPELSKGVTPDRILELLRTELRDQGLAEGQIDEYIVKNQEKLGIDNEIIDLITQKSPEGPKTEEISGTDVSSRVEESKISSNTEKITQIEDETQKVKAEIAQEVKESEELTKEVTPKEKKSDPKEKEDTLGGISVVEKVDGYAPSAEVAKDAEKLSTKGNVNESKTWQATLIERLEKMWGNIQTLFSVPASKR